MSTPAEPAGPAPAHGRRPYDLATAAADYPVWVGPPQRTLLICSHPRSGSTLLGEALYFAGGLGCPLEYFHRGFRPPLAQRWRADNIHAFLRAVYRFRTDTTGVLSVKLFWRDITDLLSELYPADYQGLQETPAASLAPTTYSAIREVLAEIFPHPTFIYLTRHDRVRQAVSTLIATQTQRWRSFPHLDEPSPRHDATYDYEHLLSLLAFADHCKAHWQHFFHATADPHHEVCYEDLVTDYAATVSALCARLGCSGPLPPPRIRRQADARSEQMVLRFLREYTERLTTTASPAATSPHTP